MPCCLSVGPGPRLGVRCGFPVRGTLSASCLSSRKWLALICDKVQGHSLTHSLLNLAARGILLSVKQKLRHLPAKVRVARVTGPGVPTAGWLTPHRRCPGVLAPMFCTLRRPPPGAGTDHSLYALPGTPFPHVHPSCPRLPLVRAQMLSSQGIFLRSPFYFILYSHPLALLCFPPKHFLPF